MNVVLESSSEPLGDGGDRPALGGVREPQDRRSSACDERETELCRDGWLCECLRECHAERVRRLLLGASPDHAHVVERRRNGLEESALPALGLEQRELPLGEAGRKRDPRRASARADVDDRAGKPIEERERPQRVVEQDTTSIVKIGDAGRAWSRERVAQPAFEIGVPANPR